MEQINIGYDWEIGHFTIINNVNLPTSILLSMAILFIYIYSYMVHITLTIQLYINM